MERLIFKTSNYNFCAEINGTIMAKDLIKQLPAKSMIQHYEGKIYFYLNNQISCKLINISNVKTGDLIYDMQTRTLCILFNDKAKIDSGERYSNSAAIAIGRILSSMDEVAQIGLGEEVKILLENEPQQYDTKILSQIEIDNVLRGLMDKK